VAASAAVIKRGAAGDLFFRVVDVTLDGSYPTGGYPLAAKDLGFGTNGQIFMVDPGTFSKTGGWMTGWDYTNNKLQVFDSSGAASAVAHEVAAATVLTGVVVRLLAFGQGQG
jgi:hypothetical protein